MTDRIGSEGGHGRTFRVHALLNPDISSASESDFHTDHN